MSFREKKRTNAKKNKRLWSSLAVLLMALILLAGCGSAGSGAPDSGNAAADKASVNSELSKARNDSKGEGSDLNRESDSQLKGTDTSAVPSTAAPADSLNRKLIYKANLTMEVKNYAQAQTELRNLVAASGAYLLEFTENTSSSEIGGNFTIKVASGGFNSLLDAMEKMNPAKQRNVTSQDVTEEYVDLAARLKAKEVVEARLLSFMEKAAKTDELLAFSAELGKVQEEIERIKGRMRFLDQNVELSTIELRMYQPIGGAFVSDGRSPLGQQLVATVNKSIEVLLSVLRGILIMLAALLPIAAASLILAIPGWFYFRHRRRKAEASRKEVRPADRDHHFLVKETSEEEKKPD
ncbi:DUF4349 domain-containing protein [Paenibacillus sp. FJAT-26967]|uniref:DUF4349 domain-containing protein n=1 Tax=Paenibacillus sp. FJAT-26967 TaxID=1729690 RepID=UPI00083915A9|nr:DUF4349 domain-containing protein [Paenibacillus sp. FJAT-26967]